MNIQDKFHEAIKNNNIDNVKLLLKNEKVNPSYFYNHPIQLVSKIGHIEIFKLLLEDKRVNPSDFDNLALSLAFDNGHFKIVNLLFKDQRVKNTLQKDRPDLYNQFILKEKIKQSMDDF